jgi:glycosyltransferase involved in cell wall biosynthesis
MWVSKGGKKRFIYKILLLLEKATFKTSNISIATNNYYKAIAIERGGKKENEVFIVRSSPSYNEFLSFIPDKPKAELKNGKKFMVGYVGVMAIQDGVDYLLRSIDNIVNKKKRTDMLFVLIGKGPEWNSLIKYAADLRLQNNVIFTGWKNRKQLVDILFACDIGVCPEPKNDYNDLSTMNKILEYMALGKPIVQYDLSEGRYLAGPASLYAMPNDELDFANKILFLIENETIRKKMGDSGKKRFIEEFSWEKSEKELREAYKYLFKSARRP